MYVTFGRLFSVMCISEVPEYINVFLMYLQVFCSALIFLKICAGVVSCHFVDNKVILTEVSCQNNRRNKITEF